MHTSTRHRRLRARLAWIACLALLFNAFAPLLARALEGRAAAPIAIEICSALGMASTPAALAPPSRDTADGGGAGQPHKAGGHCDYCVGHAPLHGLPPAPPLAFAPAAGRACRTPAPAPVLHPSFRWSPAQPRAPPALPAAPA